MVSGTLYNGKLISTFLFKKSALVFFAPALAIISMGIWATRKQNLHFIIFTFLICITIIIIPFRQGVRYIFPVLPFVLFFMIKGVINIFNILKFKEKNVFMLLSVYLLILTGYNVKNIIDYAGTGSNQSYTPEMVSIYHYISEKLAPDDIIIFFKPRVLRLFTDRNAVFTGPGQYESSCAEYLLIQKQAGKSLDKYSPEFETQNYILRKLR